jgi:hypothetical protein
MITSDKIPHWKRYLSPRFLAGKVREKGVIWCFKRAASRPFELAYQVIHRSFAYRSIKRSVGFFRWAYPTLGNVLSPTQSKERRLLAIYDLSSQPFSIGDILVIQEASLVLREKHHLDMVDFALVYDPKHPASSDPAFASITDKNVIYHLASVLPVAQVNQHLGSLFVFDSHRHLQRFIADNADLYHVWPPAWKFAERDYLSYTVFNDLLYNYFKEHGTIPQLSCRQFLVDWAQAFYREHVYPQVPVTVQVRNIKTFGTHRNLRLECWLEFFHHCQERYPVKFVVVCALAEVDDLLRQCPNVIIAKDYHTGIEQDLTLIHTAAFHMGASSGPASMAVFNTKPYLIVKTDLIPHLYRDMIQEDTFLRFCFAGPLQRLAVGPETTKLLIAEFARMWAAVDVASWGSPVTPEDKLGSEPLTWLR